MVSEMKGDNERLLYEILNDSYPGQWVREYRGLEATTINKRGNEYRRMFRFDCACPSKKIAIEIEGAVWVNGRHNRPIGMQQDMIKYNLATIEGWRILRYTPEQLMKAPGILISDVKKMIGEDSKQTKLGEPNQTKLL